MAELKNDGLGNHVRLGIVFAALCGIQVTASAGYANVSPPSGWSAPASAGERAMYRAAANETWLANTVRTTGTLNVGGRAVTMPVAMRLAANAPTFAARAMFGMNPLLLGAGLAAWALAGNLQWDAGQQKWTRPQDGSYPSTGFEYLVDFTGNNQPWTGSAEAACYNALNRHIQIDGHARTATWTEVSCTLTYVNPNVGPSNTIPVSKRASGTCPVGSWWTPAGCIANVTRVPVTEQEFVDKIAAKPMPSTVPSELPPGTPLPVDDPVINPTPGSNPQQQPMRVPMGSPVRVPNSDPAEYKQPMVRVTPAPSPMSPWQVDLTPEDVPTNNPEGQKDPETVEETDPSGEQRESDLCEKNPGILACAKPELDTPNGEIPRTSKTITYQPENLGFGGGSCPADITQMIGGRAVTIFSYAKACEILSGPVRALVLVLGAWIAMMILMPGGRTE